MFALEKGAGMEPRHKCGRQQRGRRAVGGGERGPWEMGRGESDRSQMGRSDWREMGMGSARKEEQTSEEESLGLGRRPPVREQLRTDRANMQRASSGEERNQTVLCRCCT